MNDRDISAGFVLSVGRDLQDGRCETESCEPRDHDELVAKLRVHRPGTAPWVTFGHFSSGLRRADNWLGADGVLLDIDWIDPALPTGDGHLAVPEAVAARLITAATTGNLPPGILYSTRRGFRFAALFNESVTDPDTYGHAAEELGRLVIDALEDEDLPVARDGVAGFMLDDASTRVAQVQRLPEAGMEVIVTGADLYDAARLARGGIKPALNLDAALPAVVGSAARQIGAWVQIAPEVVVMHILALASVVIGNTRCVTARGFVHNLSIQFLNLAASSAGKTTVRKYLDRTIKDIRRKVAERRKQAQDDWRKYDARLAAWKRKVGTKNEGPPPEPPTSRRRETLMLSDATTEALYKVIVDSPRGVLWSTSEAHEVLAVLGRYASDRGKGRDLDTARVRKLTEGEDAEVHRSGDDICNVLSPFLAIDMDAQPGLRDSLSEQVDNITGFSGRFLIHEPTSLSGSRDYLDPRQEPDPIVIDDVRAVLTAMWEAELKIDAEGRPVPQLLQVDPEAERIWAREMQRIEYLIPSSSPAHEGFLGHLRGRILRLAGVLALCEDPNASGVNAVAMRRAIQVVRYFLRHHRAATRSALEVETARAAAAVKEWAEGRQGSGQEVSIRELARARHRYRGRPGSALAVVHLRAAGLVPERPPKTGEAGRPKTDRWVLQNAVPKPAKSPPHAQPTHFAGFGTGTPGSNGNVGPDWTPRFDALNQALEPEFELPPGGKGTCPLCQHSDCFGRVNGSPYWKCFSSNHAAESGGLPDHGDLLDLLFHREAKRFPTKDERVQRLLAFENGGTP